MKRTFKIVSFLLMLLFSFTIYACDIHPNISSGNPPTTQGPSSSENNSGSGNEGNSASGSNSGNNSSESGQTSPDKIYEAYNNTLSDDPDNYIGDLETFVYGLIITKLEYMYDVFPAYVELSNSDCVYGIAYTDYSECYTNEEETISYTKVGFLSFAGELDISQEEFDTGLFVYDLNYEDDENTRFIWAYRSTTFTDHCVIYGAYLTYGISDMGKITFDAVTFQREAVDTSIGSLYSYDESKYLYDIDFGEYMPITGLSISETFNYAEFEEEVNSFIEEQNQNWSTYNVESMAYVSKDAVTAYLSSLQEETFLGYEVTELVSIAQDMNPLECLRITPDGLTVVDIEEAPPAGPTALVKWLVGGACVILVAASTVASIVTSACPALSAIAGAIAGSSIEIFMQVVINNTSPQNISWAKVGIAAAAGAVSGFIGPYLQSLSSTAYFFTDSAIDGLVGAIEQATFALMDGKKGTDVLADFGIGFLMGAGLSVGFKLAGKGLAKAATGISKAAKKVADKMSPALIAATTKFTKPIKAVGNAIGDTFNKLKKKADNSVFSLQRATTKKIEAKKLQLITLNKDKKLTKKSLKFLKSDGILDNNNNPISKKTLEKNFKKFKDGEIMAKYRLEIDGQIEEVFIIKKNSTFGIKFENKHTSVTLDKIFSINRKENFTNASLKLIDLWKENSSSMPKEIKDKLLEEFPGYTIEQILQESQPKILANKLVSIVEKSSYVFHEESDLLTISLVPRALHDKARKGNHGVSHMGGISILKYIKSEIGEKNFAQLIVKAVNGARVKLVINN